MRVLSDTGAMEFIKICIIGKISRYGVNIGPHSTVNIG